MLERDIEKAVCKYAKEAHGMLVYKFTSPNRRSVPDRVFITKTGRIFFIEFKATNGDPTIGQEREIRRLRAHNVHVLVISDIALGKKVIDTYAIA